MTTHIIHMITLSLTIFICLGLSAKAGCISDCRDEYESEVESCKLLWDDPDDYDMLERCIEDAKEEYESCVEECQS